MDVLLYRITNADSLTDLKAAMELESATVPEEADKASVTDAGDAGQKSSADSNTNSANE